MKKTISILALTVALGVGGVMFLKSETTAQAQVATLRCTVNDSSGSLLNIRSKPNGSKIVGKLKNGTRVAYEIESGDGQDRSWAFVRLDKKGAKPLGWVLREYLDCD